MSVSKPIEYHNTVTASQSKWPRILRYILPVLIFSTLFNLPKFFELRVETEYYPQIISNANNAYNVTNEKEVRLVLISSLIFFFWKKIWSNIIFKKNISTSKFFRFNKSYQPIWDKMKITFTITKIMQGFWLLDSSHFVL